MSRLKAAPTGIAPAPSAMPRVVDRPSFRERGYSANWDRASRAFRRDHPLCLGCSALGRVAVAELTDHVVPHRGDMVLFWDRSRWQPSCRWHHDVVKQRLEELFERGQVGGDDLRLDSAVAIELARKLEAAGIDAEG